jgi:phage protein U
MVCNINTTSVTTMKHSLVLIRTNRLWSDKFTRCIGRWPMDRQQRELDVEGVPREVVFRIALERAQDRKGDCDG